MKSRILTCVTAITSIAALAIPVRLVAQRQKEAKSEHHRYKFVDMGTFGGPASYINNAAAIGAPNQVNKRGTAVGSSSTSIPSPPSSNFTFCGGLDGTVHFVFHAFKWQDGNVTDLGALPGDDNCSVATSVNAHGEIVGHSEIAVIDPVEGIRESRAVLWKDEEITDLGTFGGSFSLVGSINDHGQVAGSATNAIPDPFSFFYVFGGFSTGTQTRAFLWQDGHKQDLGTLGGPDAQAFFVNNYGQVIGLSYADSTPNPTTQLPTADPFLWSENRGMIDLGTLGGAFGSANVLNNSGQVIGTSSLAADPGACIGIGNTANCHPFLWDDGKLIDLFTSTIGGNPITANALNDAGEIVGGGAFPNRVFDAYVWRNGAAIDLGALDGDCFSEAVAINSAGQVVGFSLSCDFSIQRSFLWENGSMVDLNTLVPPNSDLQLVETIAINDRGEIAGDGVPSGCVGGDAPCGHAYVLIPCDKDPSDNGGCADSPGGTIAVTQNHSAPVNQRSATVTQGSPTAREIIARIHARMGRRFHVPGLAPGPTN
jgi:probable HAF family extracellular repeat protein